MSTKLTSTTIILITISLFFVMMDIMSTVVNVMFHKCCHYNDQLIRDLVKNRMQIIVGENVLVCVRAVAHMSQSCSFMCSMRAPI